MPSVDLTGIMVSGLARLILRLGQLSRLSGLLASSQSINLLSRPHEAGIILLPELGSNLVEGHEHRGFIDIVFNLQMRIDMLEHKWKVRRMWRRGRRAGMGDVKSVVIHREVL